MKKMMMLVVALGMLGAMMLAGCRAGAAVEPTGHTGVAVPR